jgi:hypothetical protein
MSPFVTGEGENRPNRLEYQIVCGARSVKMKNTHCFRPKTLICLSMFDEDGSAETIASSEGIARKS